MVLESRLLNGVELTIVITGLHVGLRGFESLNPWVVFANHSCDILLRSGQLFLRCLIFREEIGQLLVGDSFF